MFAERLATGNVLQLFLAIPSTYITTLELAVLTVTATLHQFPNPTLTPEDNVTDGGEPPNGL